MAHPKWHMIPTLVISGTEVAINPPTSILSEGSFILAGVVILGFFVDGDHLSIRRIKKILQGKEKGPVVDWVNYMHTWPTAIAFAVASLILTVALPAGWLWCFPLLSYAFHMVIDGGDKSNLDIPNSPLPKSIHRFYPRWMTYETGLII